MAQSSVLTVTINENILLNGNYRNTGVEYAVNNVVGIENKIVNIPTGSFTELLKFSGSLAGASAGTLVYESLAYLRITNLEVTGSAFVKLIGAVSSSYLIELDPQQSFMINNTHISGSNEQIASLRVLTGPSATGSINMEYYLATTQ